jgi:hypothetical protein
MRVALVTTVALVAVALLAGLGVAETPGSLQLPPSPAGPVAGSLLSNTTGADDLGGALRDRGVPVPELPPCLPTTRACVDLSTAHAWLLDTGRIVRGPVSITAGDDESPTPRGDFRVQWKAPTYTSREYLVQMPWSVFFADGGIAFHQGNPDTPSAGCVKLSADDARAFFDFLQVGDRVQVV